MNPLGKIEEEFSNLPQEYIVYLETNAENSFEISTLIVKYLSEKNDKGIIVSANRPYTNLLSIYQQNNIDVSKMFIIDCLSKSQHANTPNENVAFIDNLSALTDISLSIDEKMRNTEGKKFIFFDSLTTMLIHNQPYTLARFIHNILTKMRLKCVGGVIVSLYDNSHKEIRAEIAQLCDKVVKI